MSGQSALRALTAAEYAAWLPGNIADYAADKVASGQWPQAEAHDRATTEMAELLPQGLATPDNFLYAIVDAGGEAVGMLWFAVQARGRGQVAYLYNLEVEPRHRRQGHARRALQELESEVARRGLAGIALHVFGHNSGARTLYAELGYALTNLNLYKSVAPA